MLKRFFRFLKILVVDQLSDYQLMNNAQNYLKADLNGCKREIIRCHKTLD